VRTDNENIIAEAELPGFSPEQVEILVRGDELTIKGSREEETLPENGVWHRRERAAGSFVRTLTLPGSVDPDKVQATFKNGVLSIVMPKTEHARARKIEVKGSEAKSLT